MRASALMRALRRASSTPRIMSLLPSATEIVGGLGLEGHLVGVSHECDVAPTAERLRAVLEAGCERVTTSDIDPHALPQGEIDRRVKEALETGGDGALYGVDAAAVARAAPTVLLTQTLCGVCAPATSAVDAVLAASNVEPVVANLEPTTIDDVAESFKSVAQACGVPDRGEDLVAKFYAHLDRVRRAAEAASSSRPRVLLLEWLDPPFDGGHWVPEQIEAAGCEPARNAAGGRSTGMSWDEVEAADADVVVIACCGFDLRRNVSDAVAHAPALSKLRAAREGRVYAVDGNRYFARPAQSLAAGAALVARCAHGPLDLAADDLPEEGVGWCRVDVAAAAGAGRAAASGGHVAADAGLAAAGVAAAPDGEGWAAAHAAAVAAGKETYEDPATGYSVFTSLAHQSRGKCCGSGCRHCCFDHANVRDKARKISRPAWLLAPPPDVASAAVLFWSGGKDSFLALRKLLADESDPEIILLTTFDASERRVAHQDVDIASIVRQAEHLGLPLLGVPLDRASGEAYADSIANGLAAIRRGVAIEQLCFGDLHLEHIRGWREEALSGLGADLHFPLWHADYEELSADLIASGVPCDVFATTVDAVAVGERFGEFETPHGLDAFGERGEFHTLARVWEVPRRAALGV
jgi:ABC-type Fe3+-hydroxamate transport system substrate-binding protein/diphthamide synthase (EF-2-diphthine--ammonia ligase)